MADDEEDEDGWEIESLKYLPEVFRFKKIVFFQDQNFDLFLCF